MKKKIFMSKKITVFIISAILSIIIFLGLISVQEHILFPSGRQKIYILLRNVDKNQTFDNNNFNKFFVLENVSKDLILDGAISNKKEILGTYAKQDLYKKSQITNYYIDKNKNRLQDIQNRREMSIKFSDIGEVVGGTLKEGDIIDIILTEDESGQNKIITQTELKNIYINKVFAADGTIITRTDNNKMSATTLNVILSAEDGHKLDNAIARGKIKVLKNLDDSTYKDIIIENNK